MNEMINSVATNCHGIGSGLGKALSKLEPSDLLIIGGGFGVFGLASMAIICVTGSTLKIGKVSINGRNQGD